MAWLLVGLLVLTACDAGPGDASLTDEVPTAVEVASEDISRPPKPKPSPTQAAPPSHRVLASFIHPVRPGYTVRISYEVTDIDLVIDIANAPPGSAHVGGIAGVGTLTFHNTTPGRNTSFNVETPNLSWLWDKAKHGELFGEACSDFNFAGRLYCGLGGINFQRPPGPSRTEVELGPDEATTLSDWGADVRYIKVPEASVMRFRELVLASPPDLLALSLPGGLGQLPYVCRREEGWSGRPITAILIASGQLVAKPHDDPMYWQQPCSDAVPSGDTSKDPGSH